MRKTIRKIGTSIGIIFNKEESNIHKLKEGRIIILEEPIKTIKQEKKVN